MKSMAQLMVDLSQVIGTRLSSTMISGVQKPPTLTVPSALMKNGALKPKAEILHSMKRWMTKEILKIPWLGLLHAEMRKGIEYQ
jgi:hypothetical protein